MDKTADWMAALCCHMADSASAAEANSRHEVAALQEGNRAHTLGCSYMDGDTLVVSVAFPKIGRGLAVVAVGRIVAAVEASRDYC